MWPFTWEDDDIENGARSFFDITITRDIGTLRAGDVFPYAMVHFFGDYPVLRVYDGYPLEVGTVISEFPMIAVGIEMLQEVAGDA